MAAYYNEIDLYAAEWLRNLIKAGHIADGEVDTRSIIDVQPEEIKDFDQCHFFAGIAGWSHALRLSGWEDDRKIWTGSCPCQPFSVAGQGKGVDDERHLWPHFFRLIRSCRPNVVMGEQVAGAAGYGWLDGVRSDLESENYAIEGVDIPACSANAPHIRSRLYWCAVVNSYSERRKEHSGAVSIQEKQPSVKCSSSGWTGSGESLGSESLDMDNAQSEGLEGRINNTSKPSTKTRNSNIGPTDCNSFDMADAEYQGSSFSRSNAQSESPEQFAIDNSRKEGGFWHDAIWLNGADGKTRRAQPDICLLAHGVPARVGKLRAYGNAIVPPLAAEVIKAFMEQL